MYKCLTVPAHRRGFYFINQKEYDELLERKEKRYSDDRKLFLYISMKDNKKIFVAIDNITGDFYVEDFTTLNDAMIWLASLKEAEPLKKAEECEFWW